MTRSSGYLHLHLNEMWISICKDCFRTAAQARSEDSLGEEETHDCPGPLTKKGVARVVTDDALDQTG